MIIICWYNDHLMIFWISYDDPMMIIWLIVGVVYLVIKDRCVNMHHHHHVVIKDWCANHHYHHYNNNHHLVIKNWYVNHHHHVVIKERCVNHHHPHFLVPVTIMWQSSNDHNWSTVDLVLINKQTNKQIIIRWY